MYCERHAKTTAMFTSDFRPIGQRLYEDLVDEGSTALFVRLVARDNDYDWYFDQMEDYAIEANVDRKVIQDLRDTVERRADFVSSPLDISWWVKAKHEQWEQARKDKKTTEWCRTHLLEFVFSNTKRAERTPDDVKMLIFSFLYP